MIKKLFLWLIYGGSFRLTLCERSILDAVIEHLEAAEGNRLREQIQNIQLIQREHSQRMVRIFIPHEPPDPMAACPEGVVCLAEVAFQYGETTNICHVVSNWGFLSSLEFQSAPAKGRSDSIKIDHVSIFPKNYANLPESIDQTEHAKGSH